MDNYSSGIWRKVTFEASLWPPHKHQGAHIKHSQQINEKEDKNAIQGQPSVLADKSICWARLWPEFEPQILHIKKLDPVVLICRPYTERQTQEKQSDTCRLASLKHAAWQKQEKPCLSKVEGENLLCGILIAFWQWSLLWFSEWELAISWPTLTIEVLDRYINRK